MEKTTAFLADWTENYLKNKDLILRRIEKISNLKDRIEVKYRERDHVYLIEPFLNEKSVEKVSKDHTTIVCFNTAENLDFVIKNWGKLIEFPYLSIFFVNPFSKTDRFWAIYPQTHHGISEDHALKQGLKSLSANVDETTKKEVEAILLSS